MNRHYALALCLCLLLIFAAGCEQTSIAEQEQIKSFQTLQASTPSATPPPSATPSSTPTPSPTPTLGPSSTPTQAPPPTPSPAPTVTPLPPTPTPNPALANFSLCTQTAGTADGGRFSARITTITTTLQPAFERVTIGLAVPGDSAPPHATARCLSASDDPGGAASGYSLLIDLDGWLHDDAFKATTISPTRALSGTTVLKRLTLRSDQKAVAGATLAFGLEQPLPYRLTLEQNPYRLILDVAKSGAIGPSNDMLSLPAPSGAKLDTPLFYVQGGDIWKVTDGSPRNLTKDSRAGKFGDVTALTVSTAAGRVAFCAIAPGADPGDRLATSGLWSMDLDGKGPQTLATQNPSCADPAFSPDGKTVAFTVDETGANPPRLSIWTVTSAGGDELRLTSATDEWSRFGPQWIDDDRLVYAAAAEDGRSTLFVHSADDTERDIGADLVKGETYKSLGRPLVAPDGGAIAVEGLRVNKAGADLLLIAPDGAPMPNQRQIASGYWNQPLAWSADGMLYYLSTTCPSEVAQSYTVQARSLKSGDDRLVAAGTTLGGIGGFTGIGKGLAYVTLDRAPAGPRGPLDPAADSPSTLWFWDVGGSGARAKLASAQSAIGDLAP